MIQLNDLPDCLDENSNKSVPLKKDLSNKVRATCQDKSGGQFHPNELAQKKWLDCKDPEADKSIPLKIDLSN